MYLCIDYKLGDFAGNSYYFNSFGEGKIKESDRFTTDRLYFNGDDKIDCIMAAYDFANNIQSTINSVKLKMVVDDILVKVKNEKEL